MACGRARAGASVRHAIVGERDPRRDRERDSQGTQATGRPSLRPRRTAGGRVARAISLKNEKI